MRRSRSWLACALGAVALAAALLGGCSDEPTEDTPEGALRLFLDAMDRSQWDREALREAYALLSRTARSRLEQRAARASSLSSRETEGWEMLAQGRFRLRFAPKRAGGMETEMREPRAVVIVRGEGGQRAEVPMVEEDDGWRVDLRLP